MSLSCWSPNKGIPWLWICHYEQCQGSRLLHQVSASVNPRRACHHSGEGKQSVWGNCLQTVLVFIANKYLWVKPVKPCYLSSAKFCIKFLWFIGMCLRVWPVCPLGMQALYSYTLCVWGRTRLVLKCTMVLLICCLSDLVAMTHLTGHRGPGFLKSAPISHISVNLVCRIHQLSSSVKFEPM
jgi:hypothetical protein